MPKAIPVPPAVAALPLPTPPEPAVLPRERLLDWADRLHAVAKRLHAARTEPVEAWGIVLETEVEVRTLQAEMLLLDRVLYRSVVTVDGVDGWGTDNVPGGWVQPEPSA